MLKIEKKKRLDYSGEKKMIIGIGSDLANIERFERSLTKFGERFIERTFSEQEKIEIVARKKLSLKEYASAAAKRFAAKEACAKALGTGFRDGIFLRDIEVVRLANGKPELMLRNGALKQLEKLCGGRAYNVMVTMTDDYPWAQAFVIIEVI